MLHTPGFYNVKKLYESKRKVLITGEKHEIPNLVGVLEFSLHLAKKKFQESHDVQRVKHTMW